MDELTAATDRLAVGFNGLPDDVTHRQVLTALKRAAPYIGITPRLVFFIDTLMSWSRPVDWSAGQRPIVFPSNEKLSRKLGIGVRQLQKTLTNAARRGLIAHKDSANGNRIGARGKDGRLVYAYGIDLSPLGARYHEFVQAAELGAAADERIDVLRKRLTAARRRIHSLAQLVEDERIEGIDAYLAVEISQLATRQMRKVRDETLLTACVEQIEARAEELGKAVTSVLEGRKAHQIEEKDSPSGEPGDTHNTTTNQPLTAKADYSSGFPRKSSRTGYDVGCERPQTEVEADLEKHGVDPDFIATVVPELILPHVTRPTWGELIGTAERLVGQASIHRSVWHEACRLMGQKGAAASVIATAHKHSRGDVDRPGAYLRGMNKHAAKGSLNLGRTFHGLKDSARVEGMRSLATGNDPRSIGQLAAAALGRARAGGHRAL
ncbi:plasmid replication protein RepC [uncultured Sphingomonas sp.]|uniref:plasmid replication protein RepC n=1 Tax=uncultured Sphingomonas sp. TaxID=158754 RepID=UPI0025DB5482|nr:plasmid replication protein RepC [uncultured Sphingomonas sp.]